MDNDLLEAIQEVEAKHGSLVNPNADLSKIHNIVYELGMSRGSWGHKHVRSNNLSLEKV